MKKEIANSYQFSGHETFPLRQLWLMKAVNYTNLKLSTSNGAHSAIFAGEAAMSSLGVGKNTDIPYSIFNLHSAAPETYFAPHLQLHFTRSFAHGCFSATVIQGCC